MLNLEFEEFFKIKSFDGTYYLPNKLIDYDKELFGKEQEIDSGTIRYYLKPQKENFTNKNVSLYYPLNEAFLIFNKF